jgi:hypothetical protein
VPDDIQKGVEIGKIGAAGHSASLNSAQHSVKKYATAERD